jgi:hypothetical protein
VFLSTDASVFNNELTSVKQTGSNDLLFDNLQFGLQAIEWLACGRDAEDVIVIFDEAHIRPEAGYREIQSAALFGMFQGYINWLSTNPIYGIVYPLFALYSLRRWIPSEESKRKVQMKELLEAEAEQEKLRFRTSSFFAKKINWYRMHKRYNQALALLYRRVERRINRMLGDQPFTVENAMEAIRYSKAGYLTKQHEVRITDFLTKMEDIKRNRLKVTLEDLFMEMVLEMEWISNNI